MKEFAYGIHAVESLLTHQPKNITTLFLLENRQDKRLQNLIALAKTKNIHLEFCDKKKLDQLSKQGVHQGIVALLSQQDNLTEDDLFSLINKPNCLLLILDGVQDPHNLGACLRSANAAGVDAVIIPKHRSAMLNPLVRKIACGAAEVTPLISVTNLARTLRELKNEGVWLFGTAGDAEQSIYQANFHQSCAIILGAEGEGMRRLTRETCDELLYIPMSGTVSSLNVSVATGVCLFEAVRQRSI